MKIKSALATQISGSIGGLTGAHNRGGLYLRSRAIPVNTATPQQQTVRDALSTLSVRWGNELTAAQREGWNLYGTNVPLTDTLGDARQASGIAHYVRSNTPRIQAGLPIVDNPPATYTLGTPPTGLALTLTVDGADPTSNNGSLTFTPAQASISAEQGILVYMGRPVSPGVSFFRGPYRLLTVVRGAAILPTSPQSIDAADIPYQLTDTAVRVYCYARISRGDGRLSPETRFEATLADA